MPNTPPVNLRNFSYNLQADVEAIACKLPWYTLCEDVAVYSLFIIIESALRQRVYAYQWIDIRAYFGRGGVSEYDASLVEWTLKEADYQSSRIRSFKIGPE